VRTVSLWQALQQWLATPEVAAAPASAVGGGMSGPPVVIRPSDWGARRGSPPWG